MDACKHDWRDWSDGKLLCNLCGVETRPEILRIEMTARITTLEKDNEELRKKIKELERRIYKLTTVENYSSALGLNLPD